MCVELLVAQTLIELLLLRFNLLARGVVGADQQIADDGVLSIAQGGDRHHRQEAAAILSDVGQLIDVLDAVCCVQRSSAASPRVARNSTDVRPGR